MQPRTIAALDHLGRVSWFSRVGAKDGSHVANVTSWPEAIEQCSSFDWEDLRLEALNRYRTCIAERSMARLRLWNDTLREVQKITRPLAERKTAAIARDYALPEIFGIQVRGDITLLCMESEYADVCPPGFFTSLGPWYLNGHFPCGWWGMFPAGRLVVY
jgi:hypothetical protein